MKRPQFSLRFLFVEVTLIALALGALGLASYRPLRPIAAFGFFALIGSAAGAWWGRFVLGAVLGTILYAVFIAGCLAYLFLRYPSAEFSVF